MVKFAASAALLALASVVAAQGGDLQIDTPTVGIVQCQNLRITWSGGEAPYIITLTTPSGDVDLGTHSGNFLVWQINQQANTQIGLTIKDNTALTKQSAPFTVASGSDSSCIGKPVSVSDDGGASTGAGGGSSGSSTDTGASTTAPGSASQTTPGGTTPTPSNTGSGSATGSGTGSASRTNSASNSASSPANSDGAAVSTRVGAAGLLGAAGAIMAALF